MNETRTINNITIYQQMQNENGIIMYYMVLGHYIFTHICIRINYTIEYDMIRRESNDIHVNSSIQNTLKF